jgi:chromosome segregation ATPase
MAQRPSDPISVGPEDTTGYRRNASGGRKRPPAAGERAPKMLGINLFMAVLVAGLVLAGWFIANQHQLIAEEQQALAEASARLKVLEDRLRVTDEAMTETGQTTQEKIGFWESEIRKLWSVSNERNKGWIKDNEAAITKLSASLADLSKSSRDLSAAVGRHESGFKQQQSMIDQITSVELQLQQILSTQRDIVDRVNASSQTVASLQASLAGRVKENEQAVASMDSFRAQTNSRLSEIERRLASLMSNSAL